MQDFAAKFPDGNSAFKEREKEGGKVKGKLRDNTAGIRGAIHHFISKQQCGQERATQPDCMRQSGRIRNLQETIEHLCILQHFMRERFCVAKSFNCIAECCETVGFNGRMSAFDENMM